MVAPKHFPIKKLVPELREIISTHALYLRHDHQTPNLLIALAADKDGQVHEETRGIYYRINVNLTYDNELAFHHTPLVDLRRIRHPKIVLRLCFRAQVLTLENNLEYHSRYIEQW